MDPRIRIAIEVVETDLRDPITLPYLAQLVGVSVSRFHDLFQLNTGCSPGQYFRGVRLKRARCLLETSSLAVKEIGPAVGYSDRSHFEKEFKKFFGITPSQCRTSFLPILLREQIRQKKKLHKVRDSANK